MLRTIETHCILLISQTSGSNHRGEKRGKVWYSQELHKKKNTIMLVKDSFRIFEGLAQFEKEIYREGMEGSGC